MTVVEGVISGVLSTKRLGSTMQLIFTDRRMIASRTGVSWAVMSGFGGFGAGLAMASSQKKTDSMHGLLPQQILESHKKNWDVHYFDISKVYLKKAWTCTALTITRTNGKKDSFEFPKPQFEDAKALLGSIFPHSLETKP